MARKKTVTTKTTGTEVVKSGVPDGLLSLQPIEYPVAGTSVTALQVWHNPDRRPRGDGPWTGEADKVAWIDEHTGLGCIMLRQTNGTLSGYVGVPPSHPLFGFEPDALPVALASGIHGGLTYAKPCEVNRFERRAHGRPREERYTVCHTTYVRHVQKYRTVQTTNDEFEHEDLWWFGFDTDHPGDLVPKPRLGGEHRRGGVYRDQAFAYANVLELARLLTAADDARKGERSTTPASLPSPDIGGDEA